MYSRYSCRLWTSRQCERDCGKNPLHFRKSSTSNVRCLILDHQSQFRKCLFEPKRESAVISPLIGSLLWQVIELGVVYSFLVYICMRNNIRLWSFPNQLPLCRKLLCHLTVFYWTFLICNYLRVATGNCLFLLPSSKMLLWLPYYLTPPSLFPFSLFHGCGNDIDSTFEGRARKEKKGSSTKTDVKKGTSQQQKRKKKKKRPLWLKNSPIYRVLYRNLATAKTWLIFVKCINCGKPLVCRRISESVVRAFVPRSLPLPPLPPLAARGPF